ncbi:unnamed protein product [Toxocara canis]|uniref:PHM7_cyt domain-containing protein n=1 Tax=Toxocara canis TaxID=6265 RepID=A0A183UCY8_TOXCA|nr:unnamed protein product [Toxocara canis]
MCVRSGVLCSLPLSKPLAHHMCATMVRLFDMLFGILQRELLQRHQMEGHRSRSHSQSSSGSSRSWSLIDNPELEVCDVSEIAELESNCDLTDCEYECTETGKRFKGSGDIDERCSQVDSDASILDESVELLSGSLLKGAFDVHKVWHQLDILSKCYEPPAERIVNSLLEWDSHVKILTLLAVAALLFTVATLSKFAGNNWRYVPNLDPHESICVLNEKQVLGLQYREHGSTLTGPSLEAPLRPSLSWTVRPSVGPLSPTPFVWRIDRVEDDFDIIGQTHACQPTTNQCSQKEHERRFLAMNEAVRRYLKHTESRKTAAVAKPSQGPVATTKRLSSDIKADPVGVNGPNSGWCYRWSISGFNLTIKNSKRVFNAVIDKNVWINVTASLLRVPKVATKLLGTGIMVKIMGESKLAAKFQNSKNWFEAACRISNIRILASSPATYYREIILVLLSFKKQSLLVKRYANVDITVPFQAFWTMKRSITRSIANVKEQRDRVYIESLRNGLACSKPRIDCEKCWWTGECPKKKCKFLPWQKSFDTPHFVTTQRDVLLKPFAMLGWPLRDPSRIIHRRRNAVWQVKPQKATYVQHSESENELRDRSADWLLRNRRALQKDVH